MGNSAARDLWIHVFTLTINALTVAAGLFEVRPRAHAPCRLLEAPVRLGRRTLEIPKPPAAYEAVPCSRRLSFVLILSVRHPHNPFFRGFSLKPRHQTHQRAWLPCAFSRPAWRVP